MPREKPKVRTPEAKKTFETSKSAKKEKGRGIGDVAFLTAWKHRMIQKDGPWKILRRPNGSTK